MRSRSERRSIRTVSGRMLLNTACAGALVGLLAACPDDSGFEDAGEEVDEVVDDVGDSLEDAADDVEEAFED